LSRCCCLIRFGVFVPHPLSSATAYLEYHKSFMVSTPFLKFFQKIFLNVCTGTPKGRNARSETGRLPNSCLINTALSSASYDRHSRIILKQH
jgi:hypothetical protein